MSFSDEIKKACTKNIYTSNNIPQKPMEPHLLDVRQTYVDRTFKFIVDAYKRTILEACRMEPVHCERCFISDNTGVHLRRFKYVRVRFPKYKIAKLSEPWAVSGVYPNLKWLYSQENDPIKLHYVELSDSSSYYDAHTQECLFDSSKKNAPTKEEIEKACHIDIAISRSYLITNIRPKEVQLLNHRIVEWLNEAGFRKPVWYLLPIQFYKPLSEDSFNLEGFYGELVLPDA